MHLHISVISLSLAVFVDTCKGLQPSDQAAFFQTRRFQGWRGSDSTGVTSGRRTPGLGGALQFLSYPPFRLQSSPRKPSPSA